MGEKVILLDIDIKYDIMQKYALFDILSEKIDYCLSRFQLEPKSIFVQRSQCGNTHVHIVLKDEIDGETAIMLKFCMGEDGKRLMHSVRRFEKTGRLMDFFWMSKTKECKEEDE